MGYSLTPDRFFPFLFVVAEKGEICTPQIKNMSTTNKNGTKKSGDETKWNSVVRNYIVYNFQQSNFVCSIRVFRLTGFDIKTSSAKKEAKRQITTKRKEKSNEDDMEWIPGCEEIGKKRRSKI